MNWVPKWMGFLAAAAEVPEDAGGGFWEGAVPWEEMIMPGHERHMQWFPLSILSYKLCRCFPHPPHDCFPHFLQLTGKHISLSNSQTLKHTYKLCFVFLLRILYVLRFSLPISMFYIKGPPTLISSSFHFPSLSFFFCLKYMPMLETSIHIVIHLLPFCRNPLDGCP